VGDTRSLFVLSSCLLGGKRSENLILLGGSLEATVTVLGGGINELDIDLLGLPGLDGREDGLSESDSSLAGSHDTTLNEDEIFVDLTVMGEATERGDVLGNGISLSGGVVLDTSDGTSSNSVDLVVDLSSGVITELTTSGDRPLDGGWMPGTDTGDLSETSMRLTGKSGDTESLDDTGHTLTAGNTNGINALGLLEDLADANLLLEFLDSEGGLLGDGTAVNLDFHDVGLVLSERKLADLGGADDTDSGGVFVDTGEIAGVMLLGVLILVLLLSVLGEGLLLGVHPVLVESALHIGVHVLGEDGAQGTGATGGLNVSNESDDLHRRALNDGDGVDNILLDGLLTLASFLVLDDVSHTGLVTNESGEMNGLGGVVTGERSDSSAIMTGSSLGKVGKGTAPGVFEFSMGHILRYLIMIKRCVENN